MIKENGKQVVRIVDEGKELVKIVENGLILWDSNNSCFSSGFWNDSKRWTDEKPWKD